MPEYTLFHTDGCHLCELAQALVNEAGLQVQRQDIIDSPEWVAAYGERIPVLRHSSGRELGWPFDALTLTQFTDDQSS
ncbi:Glutaredoxin-like domain [Ferrimonas sediminum]|uniref:Glutaredoxin-like domain n=1 Tax=Ferrimonas sediminum TaxID=718193 RepID=A0A1G8VVX5_9GAMM|nr:glutaredoxin family protein [Ferrimonas sediminum]SDJ70241.1 Glutaredoxin-like domain [Ferrimonas sediminum]